MFPIRWNKAFRKKDGSITTMDSAISGGTTPYELPTASAETKGGVKIGSGLTMSGEVLSANAQVPASTVDDAGKVLTVGDDGSLEWDEAGGSGGDGFIDARTLEHGSVVISSEAYNYYIIDVSNINSIIVIGAYGVSDLKSSYRQSRYRACVNYPATSEDFVTLADIDAPANGSLNARKFDVTNYNYVLACDKNGVGYSDQNFAGYCVVTPYSN